MATSSLLQAPFPYFGGKSRIAAEVWKRFGDVPNFIEPFLGSGAVLLARPQPFGGVETVNDSKGMVCNFWRAVREDADTVASYAIHPVFENDLHAIHVWLIEQKESLQARLEGDEKFFDAEVAGKWCWGMSVWIGVGWCESNGPWQIVESAGVRRLVHVGPGRGVSRPRVHLSGAGQGVSRQRVHLGDAGRGVSRAGIGEDGVYAWMEALANRFARVRVCCGDWRRVCGGRSGNALNCLFAGGNNCAVFLDPPYSAEAGRDMRTYGSHDSGTVAHDVREWAIAHGNDKRLRIALCGYEGEHDMPDDWEMVVWKANGGMAYLGKGNTQSKKNSHRERIWFNKSCINTERWLF